MRDADKIDILRVNVETPMEEIYNVSTEALRQSPVTPAVLDAFYEHHCILHSLKKWPADNAVGHASLVFELCYPESSAPWMSRAGCGSCWILQTGERRYVRSLCRYHCRDEAVDRRRAYVINGKRAKRERAREGGGHSPSTAAAAKPVRNPPVR
ncbi:hypothetical protein [Gemmiger formicilis]|uniref:hypothetical protein n=1 Tax=Gemmiger formicilis TaxID=745368 RepID=UPI003995B5C4